MTLETATPRRPDEVTGDVLREALAAARGGRLPDACAIAERGLAAGADPGPLNALLGMLRIDLGQHEQAVRHLEIAHERRPSDPQVIANLLGALVALERFDRAFELLRPEVAFADRTLQLARIRGYVADKLGDFPAAVEALEHVVATAPTDWESWNNLGNARRGARDFEGSVAALKRSVELNPSSAPSRLNYAGALRGAGRFEEAEREFRKMGEEFADDPKPLRELHVLLKDMDMPQEALEAIERAIDRAPGDLDLLLTRASHLSSLHRMEAAEAAYRKVIGLYPHDPSAYLGLALVFELSNRCTDLETLVSEAERAGIGDDAVNFIRAYHFRRARKHDEGLAALAKVPEHIESPRRAHLMAQLLEDAGRYDEAFASYARMNELFREDPRQPEQLGAAYRDTVRHFAATATDEWIASWRAETATAVQGSPVFLVGFPRSGTTLLDTFLMAHPGVEVLEEEPALRSAQQLLDFDSLPSATDEEIRAARDAYFATAESVVPLAPGKLLIDKNPLTMNLLPYVRRLFPDARIILAMRHPCDVILSCFMANFGLNAGMSNFLRLDTAGELYDLSFSYYEQVQRLMPLPTHVSVYEQLVASPESELRSLFEFLGLEWHEGVLDHETTAAKRGRIKTASYAQVVQPIYTRSAGRWEHYRKHLGPVLPVLRPWAEKFGYTV